MKAKTILSLYNGEYTFIERPVTKDSRYTYNLSKCISIEDKLEKLVDKTFDLITKALEYQNEMSSAQMEEAFICSIPIITVKNSNYLFSNYYLIFII